MPVEKPLMMMDGSPRKPNKLNWKNDNHALFAEYLREWYKIKYHFLYPNKCQIRLSLKG
jgi:hypothetical protein